MPPALVFFLSLVIEGALAGAIYALIALAFVLVYKSSRMINFAPGEWIMVGALLAGAAWHGLGLGLAVAVALAVVGMAGFGIAFSALVGRRLTARPVIALLMGTIGLGALMQGAAAPPFPGVPSRP